MKTISTFAHAVKKVSLILIVNILILELLSFCLIHSLAVIRPDLRTDLTIDQYFDTITDQDISSFWSGRDEFLGWNKMPFQNVTSVNSAGDPYSQSFGADGARNDSRAHDETLVATYGDSFTEGAEVNDDETWQFYLEHLVGGDVKNFGVSGYGIGQAFLKLQNHFKEGRVAPITMLVVFPDDLNRVVNNFRWFENRKTAGKLGFKPSYRFTDGKVRFFPNPTIDDSMTRNDFKALTMELAKRDYWMTQWVYFVPQFPYTYQIVRALPIIADKIFGRFRVVKKDTSIWNTEEGRMLVSYIFDEFYKATIANDSIPVILFIPDVRDWTDGRKVPPYDEIKALLLEASGEGPLVIDIYDAEFDARRFSVQPFHGHPSAYGNQVIADYVAKILKEFKDI